jgi:hypothetical protein
MIDAEESFKSGQNAKKTMAKEEQDIADGIKTYLSKADQFAVRMSSAIRKSGLVKSFSGNQDELFIDKSNVNQSRSNAQ